LSAAERAAQVAELAPKPPVWDGQSLAHWTAAKREFLRSGALARARVVTGHGIYSFAGRQAELARLARRD
jgi:hypothetical protein